MGTAGLAGPGRFTPMTVGEAIREILKPGGETRFLNCQGELLCGVSSVPAFYEERGYAPAWIGQKGMLPHAADLVDAISEAGYHGLSSGDYHLHVLRNLITDVELYTRIEASLAPRTMASVDVLLTDAFLLYASHLHSGRVDPETVHAHWEAWVPEIDLARTLSDAIANNRVHSALEELAPTNHEYRRLAMALREYRELARAPEPPPVPDGRLLRPGARDPRVAYIRGKLAHSGDYPTTYLEDPLLYGEKLETALRDFQARHGLEKDGLVGKRTIARLNTSTTKKIRQIELNMERWRWMPRDLGDRHVRVNIASFKLIAMEKGETVLHSRVIVGKPFLSTPVFSEPMTYVVFRPYWNVPFTIAVEEILPKAREEPGYLEERNMEVLSGWEKDAEVVDPATIDWSRLSREYFPYRIRQKPGEGNSLGNIKFMFPNHHSVYIHDTSSRHLFQKDVRSLSHGCIRVEKPAELAKWVLEGTPGWDNEAVDEALQKAENRTVLLERPVRVHLMYFTAWTSTDGKLFFLDDVYGRDSRLDEALREKPPAARPGAAETILPAPDINRLPVSRKSPDDLPAEALTEPVYNPLVE
ncbi:MAG: murein L,D-transpeptidase [Desulfatibacillaceae bacterium]